MIARTLLLMLPSIALADSQSDRAPRILAMSNSFDDDVAHTFSTFDPQVMKMDQSSGGRSYVIIPTGDNTPDGSTMTFTIDSPVTSTLHLTHPFDVTLADILATTDGQVYARQLQTEFQTGVS